MSVGDSSKQTAAERANLLVAEFSKLSDWESRYNKLIELGKAMPDLAAELRTDEALVKGCQSRVWLHAKLSPQGTMLLQGDSESVLVKGLVAVLVKVYNEADPAEVLKTPPTFLDQMGFREHLSPSRANGLFSMMKQIQMFAFVFQSTKN